MNIPTPGTLVTGPSGNDCLRLGQPLGQGAFGVVYRATDTTSGTEYAVKFPYATFGSEAELTAFFNEVQAATQISHPNVVRVVYVETAGTSIPYIVMEFISGGTLKSELDALRTDGKTVDLSLLQSLTTGLIDGIAAINARMLHRDLKPDNILLDGNTPKIGDFGLSKIVGAATRSHTFKGGQHVLYMAPEGWKLETNTIHLDMYAMGIVLFEIATLNYPFDQPSMGADITTIQNMHLYQSPKAVTVFRRDLPVGFSHIVARMLEKRPQDRFGSWDEVKQALQQLWQAQPPSNPARSSVTSLLHTAQQIHEASTRSRLEAEKRAEEEEATRRLDMFSFQKLLDTLSKTVEEFNRQSALGQIRAGWSAQALEQIAKNGSRYTAQITLPNDGKISLSAFWVNPPLSLTTGKVYYVVYMVDNTGSGFNYLLCRNDEKDLYGKWSVCRARNMALVHPSEIKHRSEPFGFDDGMDFSGDIRIQSIRHLELADRSIHIYTVQFSDDIEGAFLELLERAMRHGL